MKVLSRTYCQTVSRCIEYLENLPVSIKKINLNCKYTKYVILLYNKHRNSPSYFIHYGGGKKGGKAIYMVSLHMVINDENHFDMFIDVQGLSLIIIPFLFFIACSYIQIKMLFQPSILIPIQIFLTAMNILFGLFSIKIISLIIHRFQYYKNIMNEIESWSAISG